MTEVVWFVALERPGGRAEWDCDSLGPPDPVELLPTRRPRSGDFSRHVPRVAHSITTGAPIELESGLEHDLLRWVDMDPNVRWLVAQPVLFHFPPSINRRAIVHTPDLLSQHEDGTVTLWNARPKQRIDEDFLVRKDLTDQACQDVGWRHEVFSGLPTPTRMNLLWLSGYRRAMPWHAQQIGELKGLLEAGPLLLRDVVSKDGGSGELTAAMWHLIATGVISCDLSKPIRESSRLTWQGVPRLSAQWERYKPSSTCRVDDRPPKDLISIRIRRFAR